MKIRTALATAALAAAALTACGSPTYQQAPPSYGSAGACWYVDDASEVLALQAAGLCPVSWAPAPMPIAWRNQYAWYYDSPGYYDRYVPAQRRTTYVTHVKVYEKANPRAATKAPKVTATKASKPASFNAGNGRKGGDQAAPSSRRSFNGKPAAGGSAPRPKSGGGSSFRSGSRQ